MYGFENAEVSKGNYKETIKPGINLVKVVKIENGLSSKAQAPQLTITVEDAHGAELANSYSLNTTINPGKKMSGWDVTKNAILSIVAAANSLDEASAKAKMPNAKSAEELAQKLAMLVVGKEFRLKVTGEEKISQKGTKYVASSFGNGVFCESKSIPETDSKLFFTADKNIKKLAIEPANTDAAQSAFSSPEADSVVF
jgi:hypothetical protein